MERKERCLTFDVSLFTVGRAELRNDERIATQQVMKRITGAGIKTNFKLQT
jgi:hypothetical protein